MNSTAVFPAAWLLMIFLILVVFGAIVAIIRQSWAIGAVVILLVLLASAFLFSYRAVEMPATSTVIIHEQSGRLTTPVEFSPEQLQTADVFTTDESAARALAIAVRDEVNKVQKDKPITHIYIACDCEDTAGMIANIFKEDYPAAVFAINKNPPDRAALQLHLQFFPHPSGKNIRLSAMMGSAINVMKEVQVQPKLWVNDFDEFERANPRKQYFVSWSLVPSESREYALQQARQAAASQLAQRVANAYPQVRLNPPQGDNLWLQRYLDAQIEMGRFRTQQFVQSVKAEHFSGRIYRAAYLIDASPDNIRQIHSAVQREYQSRNSRFRHTGGGIFGLAALICLIYLFLNRATRGYFQMNLRLAATMVLIAGVLLILLIT
jgi:hypothetical protein